MVVNIYDTANDMSRQLVETQEYQGLKKALDELKADSEAFASFTISNRCRPKHSKSR